MKGVTGCTSFIPLCPKQGCRILESQGKQRQNNHTFIFARRGIFTDSKQHVHVFRLWKETRVQVEHTSLHRKTPHPFISGVIITKKKPGTDTVPKCWKGSFKKKKSIKKSGFKSCPKRKPCPFTKSFPNTQHHIKKPQKRVKTLRCFYQAWSSAVTQQKSSKRRE